MMAQKTHGLKKDIDASNANKILVICVDRDNDIGEKTGITTPVVGRDTCIEAAQRLALEDPEDADSNSIFYAIRTYEDLVSKGYDAEVITVAGTERRGIQADEKIVLEIKSVLQKFSANGAVIVLILPTAHLTYLSYVLLPHEFLHLDQNWQRRYTPTLSPL